ncbi:MAG: hypothetical protein WBX78_07660, partial [Pseudolabrys sp.]
PVVCLHLVYFFGGKHGCEPPCLAPPRTEIQQCPLCRRFIPARCNITKMSPTLLRIAGMPNYWSNINLRNELPVLENYLFPEIFSNLFDENVMQNAAAANNRKEYPRRSAVSSCV